MKRWVELHGSREGGLQAPPESRVAVGSLNPTKVNAAVTVFARLAPGWVVQGASVPSGVPEQPLGWEETTRGAFHRAEGACLALGSSWGVGLEGGVVLTEDGGWLMGVAAVVAPSGRWYARGGTVLLPPEVVDRVRAGEELGPVVDDVTGLSEAKTGMGAIGWLTGGLVLREASWVDTLARAMAPLIHPEWYRGRVSPPPA